MPRKLLYAEEPRLPFMGVARLKAPPEYNSTIVGVSDSPVVWFGVAVLAVPHRSCTAHSLAEEG